MANYKGYLEDKDGNKLFCDSYNIITGQETATNEYIDGKCVFVKRINIGQLPNATVVTIPTGVSTTYTIQRYSGYARSGSQTYNLPFFYGDDRVNLCIVDNNANLEIKTAADKRIFSGYVDIYYTK